MKYLFIRTSSADQEPQLQIADIVKTFSLTEYHIISEKDSAFKESAKRNEFEKLKSLIINNKVSELYVWDLDRLFRNRKKLVEFLALCKHSKCNVYSFNQQWLQSIQSLQSPFNEIMFEFMLQIMGWLAEDESIKKSKRVSLAIRKVDGEKTKSYKGALWGRKPLSKQVISKIKDLHLQGISVREIAKLVYVYDKNNNSRLISKSAVHKTIAIFKAEKS
jgi:DNA invertase Pin-like site-specific DNA recombinase